MTQKQPKYNRYRKLGNKQLTDENEEHRDKIRRPIVFSSDDVDRMAEESSRAKLMRKLATDPAEPPGGEFSSYFLGPKKETEPVYSITSHTMKGREQPHRSIVSTYPSLVQNIRWNPSVETSSVYNTQTDVRDVDEGPPFICKCQKCGTKHCRGQGLREFHPRVFKDNITRFSDSSTMTPKLNNASCGSCTPAVTTSNVSISGSNIAVRDNECAVAVSQVYMECDPISILKKSSRYQPVKEQDQMEYENFCTQTEKKCRIEDNYEYFEEAVKDTELDDYYEFTESKPIRSFPKIVRNKYPDYDRNEREHRKNIYNEGISNLTADNIPRTYDQVQPEIFKSPTNLNSEYKSSFAKKCTQRSDTLPFAHNTESKYHYDCKQGQMRAYYNYDNSSEQVHIYKKFRKTCPSRTFVSKAPFVKLPRRVLTSERDIESYIGKRPTKIPNY